MNQTDICRKIIYQHNPFTILSFIMQYYTIYQTKKKNKIFFYIIKYALDNIIFSRIKDRQTIDYLTRLVSKFLTYKAEGRQPTMFKEILWFLRGRWKYLQMRVHLRGRLKQSRHLENITSQEARRTYHRSGLVWGQSSPT